MKLRTLILLSWAISLGLAKAAQPGPDLATFENEIEPLLARYCVQCHGPDRVKAELRVDQLNPDLFGGHDAEHWEEVYNQLSVGEMPPDDEDQPTPEEREAITAWLSDQLREAAAVARSSGGSNVLRRLTRYEYNNTLRDLLGVDLDFARDLPPEGAAKEGFVNNSAVLGTSGLHIEYFQRIGAEAIRKALVLGEEPKGFSLQFSPEEHLPKPKAEEGELTKQEKKKRKKQPKGPIQIVDAEAAREGVILPAVAPPASDEKKPFQNGAKIRLNTRDIPTEGPFQVTIRARAVDPVPGVHSQLSIAVGHDAGNSASPFRTLGTAEVVSDELRDYTFQSRLDRFPLSGGTLKTQFIVIQNLFDEGTAKIGASPRVFIDSVSIEGGGYQAWPPASRTRILVSDDMGEVIARFLKRAYRRPPTEEEVSRMAALYETLREGELSREEAIVETLAAALAAPGFLLLAEPSKEGERRPLNDWELASRLSYFLWSTMPDERLFELAEQGELSRPEVLTAEVERMLAEEKAEAFFEHFASQWLDLDAIYNVAINPEFFPDFEDATKDVMIQETVAFFTRLVKENRSALDLIDSDEAMLNAELARHYGIPGIAGRKLRPVSLPSDSQRGGILTHGSILTLNSSGDDTHPIKRGVWVLERLLGDPPPPPPPAVPTLAEESGDGDQLSLKEKLEAHRQEDACMTCHRKIDPWGVVFENYDGIGRWRATTEGEEPVLVARHEPKAEQDLFFAQQEAVGAPTLPIPPGVDGRRKAAYREVNETLESLQRPHNHLRKLGSEGKPDQLRRFVGYIQQRTPAFEKAVDKLLAETGQGRAEFLATFRAENAEVLASNESVYRISDAIAPKETRRPGRKPRQARGTVAPVRRGTVDPSTELADGTEIANLAALKKYLLEHKRDQFAETLTRRMLAYSLGRYLDFTDTESVDAIQTEFAAAGYQMRSLIENIVFSEPFLTK